MRDSVVKSGIDPCPGIPGFTLQEIRFLTNSVLKSKILQYDLTIPDDNSSFVFADLGVCFGDEFAVDLSF